MANKYDLKIASITLGSDVKDVGSVIPEGKTRFVCFIKHSMSAGDAGVCIGESPSTGGAQDVVLDMTYFGGAAQLAYPDKIDVDNPIMSISRGAGDNTKFLTVAANGAHGTTTVVYYDE